jgi:hypothetical protein
MGRREERVESARVRVRLIPWYKWRMILNLLIVYKLHIYIGHNYTRGPRLKQPIHRGIEKYIV